MTTTTLVTLDCGHIPTPTTHGGNGTAHTIDGRTICYSCADSELAATIATSVPGDRITLYVSSDGKNITSWSGGVLMNRVKYGARHHWSDDRNYITAVDVDHRVWSGTGSRGMWASLRLTKQVTP